MPNKIEQDLSIFSLNNFKFLYGHLHGHSNLSIGSAPPSDCYNYGYRNDLDFLALVEHNDFINNEKWNLGLNHCNKFSKKHDYFIPLLGFEGKAIGLSDLNIINSNTYFTGNILDLKLLALWILQNPLAFIIISNPLKTICLKDYDPFLNKIISSIEVTCGLNTRYLRREKHYFALLDKGWILGAVNGLSESSLNFGDSENLTCVITNKYDRTSLVSSIRNRQTYSTESRSLKLFFLINNTIMGSFIERSSELQFSLIIEDKNYTINKIELISNNGIVIHSLKDINLNKIKYIYTHHPLPSETWYVIKVYQDTDKIAISSPIFIKN